MNGNSLTVDLYLVVIGLIGACLVVAGTRDWHPLQRLDEWRERKFMDSDWRKDWHR